MSLLSPSPLTAAAAAAVAVAAAGTAALLTSLPSALVTLCVSFLETDEHLFVGRTCKRLMHDASSRASWGATHVGMYLTLQEVAWLPAHAFASAMLRHAPLHIRVMQVQDYSRGRLTVSFPCALAEAELSSLDRLSAGAVQSLSVRQGEDNRYKLQPATLTRILRHPVCSDVRALQCSDDTPLLLQAMDGIPLVNVHRILLRLEGLSAGALRPLHALPSLAEVYCLDRSFAGRPWADVFSLPHVTDVQMPGPENPAQLDELTRALQRQGCTLRNLTLNDWLVDGEGVEPTPHDVFELNQRTPGDVSAHAVISEQQLRTCLAQWRSVQELSIDCSSPSSFARLLSSVGCIPGLRLLRVPLSDLSLIGPNACVLLERLLTECPLLHVLVEDEMGIVDFGPSQLAVPIRKLRQLCADLRRAAAAGGPFHPRLRDEFLDLVEGDWPPPTDRNVPPNSDEQWQAEDEQEAEVGAGETEDGVGNDNDQNTALE